MNYSLTSPPTCSVIPNRCYSTFVWKTSQHEFVRQFIRITEQSKFINRQLLLLPLLASAMIDLRFWASSLIGRCTGRITLLPTTWWCCCPARIGLAIWATGPRRAKFFCLTASLILSTSYWYLNNNSNLTEQLENENFCALGQQWNTKTHCLQQKA